MVSRRVLERPGRAIRDRARDGLAELMVDLAGAAEGHGVHGARRRLKVLRSLLRLLRRTIGEAAFRDSDTSLRAAARRLGAARRAEALQEAMEKLAKGRDENSPALVALAEMIDARRASMATPPSLRAAAHAALADLQPMEARIAAWPAAARSPDLYADAIAGTYERARRRLVRGFAADDLAMIHDGRKSVIHLLHQMEMLRPLWPRVFDAWTAELDKLREALGDLNDLQEIGAVLTASEGAAADERLAKELIDMLGARRKRLLATARRTAARLFAERPAAFRRRIGAMWKARVD
jgi:CHAD domain-containing protein